MEGEADEDGLCRLNYSNLCYRMPTPSLTRGWYTIRMEQLQGLGLPHWVRVSTQRIHHPSVQARRRVRT